MSEHTTTTTYRTQEAISGINKWTLDWDLEINITKTNSALFSLSTSKEQIKLLLKDEIVPQTDTPTCPGVKLDTRLTWKPQIEKMDRSILQKQAEILAICTAAERLLESVENGNISPFSLTPCQPFKPSTRLIQTR